MSNYGEDIRRIAGVDRLEDKLKQVAERIEILASRGIGYQNADGTIGSASGTPGETNTPGAGGSSMASGAVNGANGAAQQAAAQSGGGSAGSAAGQAALESDPTTEGITDSTNHVRTATDLFDNLSNAGVGTKLNGLTGFTDCSTGGAIGEVNLAGSYNMPEQSTDAVIRWDEQETAPAYPGYASGYTWVVAGYNGAQGGSAGEAMQKGIDYNNSISPPSGTYGPRQLYTCSITSPGVATGTTVEYLLIPFGGDPAGTPVYGNITATGTGCVAGSSSLCPSSAPKQKVWPKKASKNPTVALKSDGFRMSGNDSDAYNSSYAHYQAPQSSLALCFGSGRTATLEQNKFGGVNIYETVNGKGIGAVMVYNASQELVGFTDMAGRQSYLP